MIDFILIVVAMVLAFGAGMLVGRHNPKIAAGVQAAADKAKAEADALKQKL